MGTVKKVMIVLIALLLVIAVGLAVVMGLGMAGVLPKMDFGFLPQVELANEQSWNADEITALNVAYRSERVTLLPSEDGRVVLREYMNRWDDDMLAVTAQNSGTLSISAGERPVLTGWFNWRAKIELYLPREWLCDLRVENSSGGIHSDAGFSFRSFVAATHSGSIKMHSIETEGDLTLSANSGGVTADVLRAGGNVQLSASSGSIRPGQVEGAAITAKANSGSVKFESAVAGHIEATTSSGSLKFERLEGSFELRANSGGVSVEGGSGAGSAEASSGSVKLTLEELTGDVRMSTNSGGCRLALPEGTAVYLKATTGSGGVHVPDERNVSYDRSGNITGGSVGENPVHTVEMKTGSGSARLEWD